MAENVDRIFHIWKTADSSYMKNILGTKKTPPKRCFLIYAAESVLGSFQISTEDVSSSI